MNNRINLIFLLILLIPCFSTADETNYKKEIQIINSQTIEKLGISLPALAYFLEFGPLEALVPECFVKSSGKIVYISELVSEGYITMDEHDVPEELKNTNQGRFLKLNVTEKGNSLLAGLDIPGNKELLDKTKNLACN